MNEESTSSYEFCLTVVGTGNDIDEAFQNALDLLKENPNEAIKGEVIYVNLSTKDSNEENDVDN